MKLWSWEHCTPAPPSLWCCRLSAMLALYPFPQGCRLQEVLQKLIDGLPHSVTHKVSKHLTVTHLLKNSRHSLSAYPVSGTALSA